MNDADRFKKANEPTKLAVDDRAPHADKMDKKMPQDPGPKHKPPQIGGAAHGPMAATEIAPGQAAQPPMPTPTGGQFQISAGSPAATPPAHAQAQAPFRVADAMHKPMHAAAPAQETPRTVFVGASPLPQAAPVVTAKTGPSSNPAPQATMTHFDPVVGWLVVIAGPGKGQARQIFNGNNAIGRSPKERIPLDFGDDAISGEQQAFLRYDPSDRTFLLVPNLAKANLVSVNEKRPTGAVALTAGDVIGMGRTKLLFAPLCGQHFDWSDQDGKM